MGSVGAGLKPPLQQGNLFYAPSSKFYKVNGLMQKSYTFNYLKIYLWQGISIVMNLLSMFIVIPRLADKPSIYGIYVVCISANIFLTYADIGFAGAGHKYASECFAQKNLEEEIKIVGFIGFILLLFVIIFALAVSGIALNPSILIKNLHNAAEINIASKLLLILALFSPLIIFQRMLDIVYGIRLEQFILQRIMIMASVLKILSVFYFFKNNHYNIVGYYLFCQLVYLAAIFFCLLIANIKYKYKFIVFFKSFKFSKHVFTKTKTLAFGSLFSTIMFILYYELDAFAIAKLLGPESVAIYAVGFTILAFLRGLLGVLYAPFLARFNHFIGLHDIDGLRDLYRSILPLTLPFVIFPIVSLALLMGPLVHSWVGNYYDKSVIIAQLLILGFIYAFIGYPASFLIIAQEKIKILYLTSAISPIVYWTGIVLMIPYIGLTSFALFKFIAMSITSMLYLFITLKFLEISAGDFVRKILGPVAIPLGFLILSLSYLNHFMPTEKNALDLFIVVATGGLASAGALILYYLFSSHFRNYAQGLFRKCFA
jgi:O-antigen/teichoic acid export membrane protein